MLITLGLALLMMRSRLGLAIGATGMDRGAARLLGIRARHVYAVTFGISAAPAGVAGTMIATVREGSRRRAIGLGDAAAVEALGLAKARGYEAQARSLGSTPTAAVAIAGALSEGKLDVMPEVLVTGGGGALHGLAAAFMRSLNGNGKGEGHHEEGAR